MIILCLLSVFPLTLGKCFEGETYPVNQLEQWTGYFCYDLKGNKYKPDQTILSCCGCIKLTCTASQVPTNSYGMWTSFWKESEEATCCKDCHGKVFPIGSVISSTLLKDNCSTTVTKYCVSQSRGNDSFARISDNYKSKSCCYDSTGVHPLGKAILDPKTCSSKVCSLPQGSLNGVWISSTKKCPGLGCDCCVHEGELVCDGGHITLPNGVNATCCDGMLMKPQNPDEDMTSTTTSIPITTTTITSTTPAMTGSIYFIAGGNDAERDIELYHPTMANLSCSLSPPPLNNDWIFHTTFYYNNTLHLYGGWSTAYTCISYNINTEQWNTHTLSTPRKIGHSSTILNKRVYIIGGQDTSNNYVGAEFTPLPLTDQPVLKPVFNLDYKGEGQCTTKMDEDTLVVTGGHGYNGYSSSVLEYNAKTRTTTSLPSMKQKRYNHGCAVVEMDNTKWIIVAGGYNRADKYLNSTEMLQIGGSSWKRFGNLNVARHGHSIAVSQRGVMAMGGYDGGNELLSSVELLDWSAMSWRIVQPSLSKSRYNFGEAVEIPASMFDCRGQ